jgi:hypothetical protein
MTKLVFIWLGNSFPDWGQKAIQLSKRFSKAKIVLITGAEVKYVDGADEHYYIEDFYIPPDSWELAKKNIDTKFRDGFWFKTTERFFVLEQFMKNYSVNSIFHAELDNLVFNISNLGPELDKIGSGVFCPRDSEDRGIASLIYINDVDALSELILLAQNNSLVDKNDMALLGYLLKSSSHFFSLSTEIAFAKQPSDNWNPIAAAKTNGIFDAAAIGQFLFGIDPRNASILLFNGFENENAGFDLWKLNYEFDLNNESFRVTCPQTSTAHNLYNIHVHSKLFHQLSNEKRVKEIINRINNKKKTLMSFDILQNFFYRGIKSRIIGGLRLQARS